MVTLTNAQAQAAHGALTELSRSMLPPAGALRVRKTLRDLGPHLADVEAERQKLIGEYGLKDADGKLVLKDSAGQIVTDGVGTVQFADDAARQAFAEGYAELMAATWSTEFPIRASDLGSTAPMRAETLLALGNLLVEEEEAKRR
ncbi:MAG: hypothetical protein ACYC5O_00885 [Anaerolineae bacterium]